MSIARHHTEWLSLIEVSGPFLSMPVLLRVFPQGLDAHEPELSRFLRMRSGLITRPGHGLIRRSIRSGYVMC
jgi:hypothetical protein